MSDVRCQMLDAGSENMAQQRDANGGERSVKSHRDLIAWQRSMDLAVCVYKVTKEFPREEAYGLTSQIRRCAASVPANIAEGQGRRSSREFHQFLGNARGSLLELDTHFELASRVGYIGEEQHTILKERINEVGRILNGLMRSIANGSNSFYSAAG